MFASNTLSEHILRGAIGIGALWIAVAITERIRGVRSRWALWC